MDNDQIARILKMKNVAIVGMSNKTYRPSYQIYKYLSRNGYNMFFVNPYNKVIDQKECYEKLEAIKLNIDVVNIFRKCENVLTFIYSAIKIKAKAIWMQDGVRNQEAYNIARNNGLLVVMDNCIIRQHQKT
tara:strand:- start:336 stop:728 length:393 start_codon:yes stop_codon:yes gene_type:complete